MIIPAATVRSVAGSTRMKLPVVRLIRYSSKKSGEVVWIATRPMSLTSSVSAARSRCRVSTSSW